MGFFPVGHEVWRKDVHVVPGAHGFFLFLDPHLLKVGQFVFDPLDDVRLVDGLDVEVDCNRDFHVEQVGQHPVG